MDTIKHALVLTGDVQPGFVPAEVWSALATFFRMEPERLRSELLARVPIAIKESDDLAKLQTLQSGAAAVGAVTELHALGSDGSLFVLVNNTPRGPVPHSFVDDRVRSGVWPSNINIAAVGSANWRPFIAAAPASPAMPPRAAPSSDQQATVAFTALSAQPGQFSTKPVSDLRAAAPAAASYGTGQGTPQSSAGLLPEGLVIHAGFWRRVAAYTADSFVLSIVMGILFGVIFAASTAAIASDHGGIAFALMGLGYVLLIVIAWLYFAKFESGATQATPGKRLMGLKVTDDKGQRISFGRATGRFFGKIVTGIIPFGIGYMLAGWTGRKQALHDMMAGTCIVFRDVEPGRPLPTVRPPMPWYGWVLNVLPFVVAAVMVAGYSYFIAMMLGNARQDLSNIDMSGINDDATSMSQSSTSMSQNSDPDAEQAIVLAGLSGIADEVEAAKAESAKALEANNTCLSEERPSSNAWIESIQFGGFAPQCTVTVRLSSSSDIPFAARIERIEWSNNDSGTWTCSSSMDASYLPWPCQ